MRHSRADDGYVYTYTSAYPRHDRTGLDGTGQDHTGPYQTARDCTRYCVLCQITIVVLVVVAATAVVVVVIIVI